MDTDLTLVLGATGRIGAALRRFAPQNMRWQGRQAVSDAHKAEDWRIFAPLDDPAALHRAAEGCAHILCLAGAVPGRGGDLADNTRLATAAIEAAAQVGARVILTSSAAVYGAARGALNEDRALEPANPYGQAKAEMEAAATALGQRLGVAVCALRIGNIAGFDAILGGWQPGFSLDQFEDGTTPRRSYVGVKTLAEMLQMLLARPDLPTALNIAQPGPVAMGDLLEAGGLDWQPRPAPKGAIGEVALDLARLIAIVPGATQPPIAQADPHQLVAEWRMLQDQQR